MKFKVIEQNFHSHRMTWGLLTGVAGATLFIIWMPNDVFAGVLGVLISLLVARPTELKVFIVLGCATGIITGPVAGVQQYLNTTPSPATLNLPALLLAILNWLILSACLGAVYGFIMGKFAQLYLKGHGPFF